MEREPYEGVPDEEAGRLVAGFFAVLPFLGLFVMMLLMHLR